MSQRTRRNTNCGSVDLKSCHPLLFAYVSTFAGISYPRYKLGRIMHRFLSKVFRSEVSTTTKDFIARHLIELFWGKNKFPTPPTQKFESIIEFPFTTLSLNILVRREESRTSGNPLKFLSNHLRLSGCHDYNASIPFEIRH